MRISDWSSDVCSSDLLAFHEDDGVAPDQVDAADMRVQVYADARPAQAGGDLLDMAGLAAAVIALHHHAAVIGEARQDREGGVRIEDIGGVEVGNPLVSLRKGGDLHVDIDAEHFARVDFAVGRDRKSTRLNSST